MAILYSYPLGVPTTSDLLVGSKISTLNDDASPVTENYSIGSIIGMVSTATGAQTFNQVANVGSLAANQPGGNETVHLITFKDIRVKGVFKDTAGGVGSTGQVLSSTVTGTAWSTAGGSGVTTVTGTAPIVSSGGTTPAISLANTAVTAGAYTNTNLTVNAKGLITAAASGTASGVISVAAYNTTAEIDRKYAGLHPVTAAVGAVKVGLAVTQMTSIAEAVADEDLMIVTDDPSGIPYNKKITVGNLKTHIITGNVGVTSVTATLPMLSSGGTAPVISINTMGVANASTAGLKGAVPASLAGDQLKFLRADATWQVPLTGDNTTYSISIPDTTTKLRLTGASPASTDDIEFVGGGITTVSRTNENKFTITSTEADTLQSVTTRGATSNQAITLSNNLLINGTSVGSVTLAGTGVGGYLYVTGNAGLGGVTIPSHSQGIALAYNNSAGQRESELFWNTGGGSNTPAINNVSYFGIYNEFIDSTAGNARVTNNQVKLYGTGSLELTRPNAGLITPHFSSPIVAGAQNSLLARSNTKQTAFTTTLSYNETNATLAILPASGTPSEIQMKSANNDIWKLVISNAGALVITGPF